mmetsp:Transcript_37412/g.79838  ORF Transcript_37412/g.79838 Transcript_37412/m.79838 type:complete len:331 (+) Transcript_37412:1200-2192(+)
MQVTIEILNPLMHVFDYLPICWRCCIRRFKWRRQRFWKFEFGGRRRNVLHCQPVYCAMDENGISHDRGYGRKVQILTQRSLGTHLVQEAVHHLLVRDAYQDQFRRILDLLTQGGDVVRVWVGRVFTVNLLQQPNLLPSELERVRTSQRVTEHVPQPFRARVHIVQTLFRAVHGLLLPRILQVLPQALRLLVPKWFWDVIDIPRHVRFRQLAGEPQLVQVPIAHQQVHAIAVPALEARQRAHDANVPRPLVDGVTPVDESSAGAEGQSPKLDLFALDHHGWRALGFLPREYVAPFHVIQEIIPVSLHVRQVADPESFSRRATIEVASVSRR